MGDGGADRQDVVPLAARAGESMRALARALLDAGPAGFEEPGDVAALLDQLREVAARLPKVLLLAVAWLEVHQLRGHIGQVSSPDGSVEAAFAAAEGVAEVGALLRQAQGLTRQLTATIDGAA
jgi:hypothetical protein